MFKYFRDKTSGKIYTKIDGVMCAEVVDTSSLDLEEVNESVMARNTYAVKHWASDTNTIDELMQRKYALKDVVGVPVDGKPVDFRVEHIIHNDDGTDTVYFVSVDVVGKSTMTNMDQFLDAYTAKMSHELVSRMRVMEHKTNKGHCKKRKLSLLSLGNLKNMEGYCIGADDMIFDGLRTEAERCKNDEDGYTSWYWLDTPSLLYTTSFMYVSNGGGPGNGSNYASNAGSVALSFSILTGGI